MICHCDLHFRAAVVCLVDAAFSLQVFSKFNKNMRKGKRGDFEKGGRERSVTKTVSTPSSGGFDDNKWDNGDSRSSALTTCRNCVSY